MDRQDVVLFGINIIITHSVALQSDEESGRCVPSVLRRPWGVALQRRYYAGCIETATSYHNRAGQSW